MRVVVALLFFCAVAAAVYLFMAESAKAPAEGEMGVVSGNNDQSEKLPDGVSVVERDGKRILRDERVGYEMNMGNNILINNQNESLVIYSTLESSLPDVNLLFVENKNNLNADDWIEKYNENHGLLFYDSREKFITNTGVEGYKIKEEGEIEHYSYHIILKSGVLIVDTPLVDIYEPLIKTIKLFN